MIGDEALSLHAAGESLFGLERLSMPTGVVLSDPQLDGEALNGF